MPCAPGPLADGLAMDDAPAFDEWLATARQRVAGLHQRALQASAAFHEARGDINAALARVQALLQGDLLQESHHRDAMRVLAEQPPDLRGLAPWVQTELARLLPDLGIAPAPLQGETERLRFDEACILAWSRLAADSFDAIVLDDWHHADAASHALLGRVAARRRDQGGAGPSKCWSAGQNTAAVPRPWRRWARLPTPWW